ncbi:MAG: DNA replication and repair protein RecF [Ignavibacteria bacterium]|jgi:DNA replication and repair protein RecF
MILEDLLLSNFRNYASSSFKFNPKLNFIFGENGNGKTNILEAVSMICYTKSFLQSSESDCVRYGMKEFEIEGNFFNNSGLRSNVMFTYDIESSKKLVTYNNEYINRLSSFFGKIPLVVLSPIDIKLTTGTPADKRRNFDILISQISRLYLDDLKRYNRILKQKNSLLKDNMVSGRYNRKDLGEMLGAWDKELIETGVRIIIKRLLFIKEFQDYLVLHFRDIAGANYIPLLDYESELMEERDDDVPDESVLKEKFAVILAEKRIIEIKRGMSLAGPQRDNYIFKMKKNGSVFELKNFASQGEHKIFIVALKLSEYIYLRDKLESDLCGEPILLLDDLFSELDQNRTQRISAILPKFNQLFITTTDNGYQNILKKYFNRENITAFNIVNGTSKVVN